MAQRLFIPRLGHTMTEGIVAKWYPSQDAAVAVGDPLYDLEYDKATETVEAEKAGIIKMLVEEGATVPVGETIGVVLEAGEDLDAVLNQRIYKAFVAQTPNIPVAVKSPAYKKSAIAAPHIPAVPTAPAQNANADLIVIGGGPGGYVAAIRASLRGARVILIEKDRLGGTCLNRGCIPTKALLQSAELYAACRTAADYGVSVGAPTADMAAIDARKEKVIDTLVKSVQGLLNARKVEVIPGTASIAAPGCVAVALAGGGEKKLTASNIVIATGSTPSLPPIPGIDGKAVIVSDAALSLKTFPKRLVIIGGGVIGMELGSVYAAFGCCVTVLEAMPEILPNLDGEIQKAFHRIAKRTIDIHTNCLVERIEDCEGGKRVVFRRGEVQQSVEADAVLVTTGRRARLDGLNLESIGVKTEQGHVVVDEEWRTSIPGIFCIGDANGNTMLAHAASAQGIDVADRITGHASVLGNKHEIVPACIYTAPEIASVGKTEEQLKAENIPYKVAKFNLRANGRALILNETSGFIKLLADTENNALLGAHIIGPFATELIGECALALRLECTLEELAGTIHAHPTVGEAIMEAAEAGLCGSIHSL